MSQKRLLLVNNTVFYENGKHLFLNKETGNFFLRLTDFDFHVTAFQISQPISAKDTFANFKISGTALEILNISRKNSRLWGFIRAFFVIPFVIAKADLVYLFYPGPICQVVALFCVFFNRKFGLYVRGEQGIKSKLSLFLLKRASIVTTISPLFTERVKGINPEAFTIRPMIGFNESDIVEEKEVQEQERYSILFVGRLAFDKGIFELLEAIKELIKQGFDIRLTFVGNGPDRERIECQVKEMGLGNQVVFPGMITDLTLLKVFYNEADIFVLPSYHEGFPRVLYEALIMGVPILTTFVGAISYLMKDNENCLKLEVQSAQSIMEKLKVLLKDMTLRSRLSINGTLTIKEYLKDNQKSHAEILADFITYKKW